MSKPVYIYIVGDSETNIWGLSGRERLQRMLKPSSQTRLVDDPEQIPVHASALLLRADHLFDARVLAALINAKTNLVLGSNQGQSVAIRVIDGDVHQVLANFVEGGDERTFSDFPLYALKDLDLSSLRQNLKKRDPPYVLPINNDNRQMLESELFTEILQGGDRSRDKMALAGSRILDGTLLRTLRHTAQSHYTAQSCVCRTGRGCVLA